MTAPGRPARNRRCGNIARVRINPAKRESCQAQLPRQSGNTVLHAEGLRSLLIFLVAAGIIVPLLHRLRVGTVLGFLLVGLALGPFGLGALAEQFPVIKYITFDDPKRAEPLAELGIVFLLFLLGLELSLQRLWQLRRYVLGVGARSDDRVGRRNRPDRALQRHRAARRHRPRLVSGAVLDRDRDAAPDRSAPRGGAGRPRRAVGAAVPGPDGGADPVHREHPQRAPRRPAQVAGRSAGAVRTIAGRRRAHHGGRKISGHRR